MKLRSLDFPRIIFSSHERFIQKFAKSEKNNDFFRFLFIISLTPKVFDCKNLEVWIENSSKLLFLEKTFLKHFCSYLLPSINHFFDKIRTAAPVKKECQKV